MYYRFTIFLLFLCTFNQSARGQSWNSINLNTQNFKIQQGLPSNNTIFTFQDSKGFIWISTLNGLAKYDGYSFTNIMPNSNKKDYFYVGQFSSALPINDSLFYLTSRHDGLFTLNTKNNEIIKIKNSPQFILTICKSKEGNYWLGTKSNGFFYFNQRTGKFTPFVLKKSKDEYYNWLNNTVNSILPDKFNDSILWLGTRSGLIKFNIFTYKKTFYFQNSSISPMQQFVLNDILSMTYAKDGSIWVGRIFGGLGNFNIQSSKWENYYYDTKTAKDEIANNNIVNSVRFINDSTLILGTSEAAFNFNIHSKLFTKYTLLFNNQKSTVGVLSVFTDNHNNQWFTHSDQQGLSVASPQLNATIKVDFPIQRFKPDHYAGVCFDMLYSNRYKHYFVATASHDGFLEYDTTFNLIDQKIIPYKNGDNEPSASCIAEDDGGNIWITNYLNQLILYNPQNKVFNLFSSTNFKNCYAIYKNEFGKPYFHTDNGLFVCENKIWIKILETKPDVLITHVFRNKIYFIEGLKVFLFDIKTSKITPILAIPKYAIENGNYIQNIFNDSKDRLWITLEFGGVYRFDGQKLRLFNSQDGIISNATRVVKEDNYGRIYLLCNGGLYYFQESQQKFLDLDNLSSKKTNDWYEHFISFTKDGKLILSKENAFYILDQDKVIESTKTLPVFSKISGQAYEFLLPKSIVQVPNFQNDIKIEFTTFDFSSASEIIFEYQISGDDSAWITLPKGVNFIQLTNLAEGKYNCKVRVLGSAEYSICSFQIQVIWYKSKLFYYLISIAIFIILLLFFVFYLRTNNKRFILKRRIAELKLHSLQSQLNPHFLFNCFTSINGLIKTGEYSKAETIIQDFATLMRSILTHAEKDFISIEEEINLSTLYMEIEKIRKNNNFDYEIIFSSDFPKITKVPPFILQPFLENSIKHGFINKTPQNKGQIKILINKTKSGFVLVIKDNGTGKLRENNEFQLRLHKSMGIAIQQERLAQYKITHNVVIAINTDYFPDIGTTVTIDFNNA